MDQALTFSLLSLLSGVLQYGVGSLYVLKWPGWSPHIDQELSLLIAIMILQSKVTSIITTILTAFTSFGLTAVSAWFASERWTYNHHQGRKWLGDVLDDANERFMQIRAMVATRRMVLWSSTRIKRAGLSLSRVPSFYAPSHAGSDGEKPEEDTGGLPFTRNPNNSGPMSPIERSQGFAFNHFDHRTPVMSAISLDGHSEYSATTEAASQVSPISPARQRLQHAVRSVIMMQGGMASAFATRGKKSATNDGEGDVDDCTRKELQMDMARSSRVGSLVPKLRQMEPTTDLNGHQALVKHLQFSPDGSLLATSSWDRTSLICELNF